MGSLFPRTGGRACSRRALAAARDSLGAFRPASDHQVTVPVPQSWTLLGTTQRRMVRQY